MKICFILILKRYDKIFTSNSIREYIYKTLFTKPKGYQVNLIDNKDALYCKGVNLERKISKKCLFKI